MTEPNNRELNEKIADIREWLVRIDTKVDFFNEVRMTAERAEEKADGANQKAEKALQNTDVNKEAINKMQTTTKWAIGLMVTAIVGIGSIVVTIAF